MIVSFGLQIIKRSDFKEATVLSSNQPVSRTEPREQASPLERVPQDRESNTTLFSSIAYGDYIPSYDSGTEQCSYTYYDTVPAPTSPASSTTPIPVSQTPTPSGSTPTPSTPGTSPTPTPSGSTPTPSLP